MDMTHPPDVVSVPAAPSPRPKRPLGYVVVAVVSLGVGAAATYAIVGARHPSPSNGAAISMQEMTMTTGGQAPPSSSPNAVYIDPARQQLIGVRTGVVDHQMLEGTIRTVGSLQFDQTRVTEIHTKIAGWVDRVDVDYLGKSVRRGAPLFRIYSPDLVTSQNDVLVALAARDGAKNPDAKANAESLLAAARERLKRWDVTDAELKRLEGSRQVSKYLTLYSPFDGVVLERNAYPGQYLAPETTAFKIGDVSTVWAVGEVFESDLPRVHVGQAIDVDFPYGQAPPLHGKLVFVSPDIDPQTRRASVRANVENHGLVLKPQTYISLVVHGDPAHVLAVPRDAILDSGTRRYALLALPNGYFEPRDVELGPPQGDYYPVLKGLAHGDRVVTSAQFLVDSETNLKAAMAGMAMSMPGMDMSGGGDMGGMAMPDAGATRPHATPAGAGASPHETQRMESMPGMDMSHGMPGMDMPHDGGP
jgi:RND family efflux transporter MFP subunit